MSKIWGKKLPDNNDPKPDNTLSTWNGPDIRVDAWHQYAVPISGEIYRYFSDSWHEEAHFSFKKRFHGGREIRNSRPTTRLWPTTPLVKGLLIVRWAKGKKLTNRVPNLSLVVLPTTLFVKALVRWAKATRSTNLLPNLSLITLSPYYSNTRVFNSRIEWRIGADSGRAGQKKRFTTVKNTHKSNIITRRLDSH